MADKNYKLHFNMTDGTIQEVQFSVPSGETPKKGVDYFTKEDKEEFLNDVEAVLYTEQTLTAEQQAQARENIGVDDSKLFFVTIDDEMKPSHGAEEIIAAAAGGKQPVFSIFNAGLLTEWIPADDGSYVDFTGFVSAPSNEDGKIFEVGKIIIRIKTCDEVIYEYTELLESGVLEPLIGSTDDITPSQVSEALREGRNITVSHTDPTYGIIYFTSFTDVPALDAVASSGVQDYANGDDSISIMRFSLVGFVNNSNNLWNFTYSALANYEDIPTSLSDLADDPSHRLITDFEREIWNARPSFADIPTFVSQLQNDAGYLTQHQDISGKLDASALPSAINIALAQAKESGEFDGPMGPAYILTDEDRTAIVNAVVAALPTWTGGSY